MIYKNHRDRDYSGDTYNLVDLDLVVRATTAALKPIRDQFDSIAVNSGMSGVIIGVPVSLRLRKPLVIFRKPGDDSHAWKKTINIDALGTRVLFLDDIVSSGRTRSFVAEHVRANGGKLIGEYLYDETDPESYPTGPLRLGKHSFRDGNSADYGRVPF